MPKAMNAARRADSPEGTLQVICCGDGDIMVFIKSSDQELGVGFCTAINGGGYHPRTIAALYALAQAIKADNDDPQSPPRYKVY